jgi:hypothetical protein
VFNGVEFEFESNSNSNYNEIHIQNYLQKLTANLGRFLSSKVYRRPLISKSVNRETQIAAQPRAPASPTTLPPLLSRCQAGSARQPTLLTLLPPSFVPSLPTHARGVRLVMGRPAPRWHARQTARAPQPQPRALRLGKSPIYP